LWQKNTECVATGCDGLGDTRMLIAEIDGLTAIRAGDAADHRRPV
jgi:hypothetical protein